VPELFNLVVNSESGGYLYTFSPQSRSPISGGKTSAADVSRMGEFLKSGYYTVLREATEGSLTASGVRTHIRNLQGLGNQLYRDVIPSELKEAVTRMAKGDLLHVFADTPGIPWELVKNGSDFWGQLYAISNSRWTGAARKEPTPLTLPVRKILNVIGHGVSAPVAERARQLFQDIHERADIQLIDGSADQEATDQFYEQLPTADLVHFTGHGKMGNAGIYLQIVRQESSAANFMVTSIDTASLRPGCIVFANACISGETKTVISRSLGFGPSFCENGASAFIGTLDLVPDLAAVLFAETFYNQLFSGLEVGRALWAARQSPLKVDGTTSLAPLLYSLYGNPRETVEL
jgi:hypothetical protein